jgi:hypothetical protein
MARFPANDIISLVGSTPRYDLAESVGPDLRLADLVDPAELGDLPLAYGTAAAPTMSSSQSAACTRCFYWPSFCATAVTRL